MNAAEPAVALNLSTGKLGALRKQTHISKDTYHPADQRS